MQQQKSIETALGEDLVADPVVHAAASAGGDLWLGLGLGLGLAASAGGDLGLGRLGDGRRSGGSAAPTPARVTLRSGYTQRAAQLECCLREPVAGESGQG